MRPIQIFAGQHAFEHIRNNGLNVSDIRVILGASGGPKWFVLSHLDRYLTSEIIPSIHHQIELVGSSIGAWRMAAYAGTSPIDAIEKLENNYLNQRYSDKPTAKEVSNSVEQLLDSFISDSDLKHHHNKKLHIVAARTKGLCTTEQKKVQALAFAAVAAGNLISRKTLPFWFDRVVFQSSKGLLPLTSWDSFQTDLVNLNRNNYRDALLASGAIPVVIDGVLNPHDAPKGMYRDGGMVDYHFDLPLKPNNGLVLYPHFAPVLKPGWFDKPLHWRKVQADNYSHTVVICPSREFVASLPYAKIPDRKDFENLDNDTRIRYWQTVIDRNQMISEAFDNWLNQPEQHRDVEPISALAK